MRFPRLAAALTGLVVLTGLAACSSSEPEPATAGAAPTSADGAFPVTLTHVYGETTVEAAPQRVVALGVTDSDPLLGLGIIPIAVQPFTFYAETGVGPWAEPLLDGQEITVLDPAAEVSVEEVAALEPDLIVAVSSGIEQDVYDQLAQVAPTLARPEGTVAFGVGRDDATRIIARAVGKEAEGEELIATADAAFTDAVAANPQLEGATAAVLLPFNGVYGAYTPVDARGRLVDELGLDLPAGIADLDTGESFFVELSTELLNLAEGDALVVLTDDTSRPVVEADAVLQNLDVVTSGGLILPDADLRGAMTYNTVLSAPFAVEQLTPLLVDALAATAG